MDSDSLMDEWSSDDASESQPHDVPDLDNDSQRATAGRRSQLRPAGLGLAFVPLADWKPELSYDEQPPENIRYDVEWKLSVNNRQRSGESEPRVVISPRAFWKHVLRSKLRTTVDKSPKSWEPSETKIVLSVRKTSNITKRFAKLDVDWPYLARQFQDWSHFLRSGKKLSMQVTFYYVEGGNKAAPAVRGATATQSAENNARSDAEKAVLGQPDSWRRVIALVRCPGPPCDKGPYCWQDGQKHYKLLSHHLKILVNETQRGCRMETHDDVPDRIRSELYAEEQQRGERERKRRRGDSGSRAASPPAIHIHNLAGGDANATKYAPGTPSTPEMVFPTSPAFQVSGPRDGAVEAYVEWQQLKVSSQEQKNQYGWARDLTVEHGLSLEMLYCNRRRYFQFLKKYGVLEGVAWHFVCDIKSFLGSLQAYDN